MGPKEREGEVKRVVVYCPAEGETEKFGEVYRDRGSWQEASYMTARGLARGRTYEHSGLMIGQCGSQECLILGENVSREFKSILPAVQWFIDNASLGM